MKTWITPDGCYYVGAHVAEGSIEVPERPTEFHQWINGAWVLDTSALIEVTMKEMDDAIRARLNAKAATMDFADMAGAIGAASLPLGEFRQDDGAKLHLWAARTWQRAKEIRDAFLVAFAEDPTSPLPTWEEVEAALPTYPISAD